MIEKPGFGAHVNADGYYIENNSGKAILAIVDDRGCEFLATTDATNLESCGILPGNTMSLDLSSNQNGNKVTYSVMPDNRGTDEWQAITDRLQAALGDGNPIEEL